MLLHQVALSSFHNGWVRAHEGHRILLDLVTEEQCAPICKAHMHLTEILLYQFVFVFKMITFLQFYEKPCEELKVRHASAVKVPKKNND